MNKIKQNVKKLAFTIAEVLITLGIVGIVAECTIPTLFNNVSEQNYKVAYKKAYSLASQVWSQAMSDNSLSMVNFSGEGASKVANFNVFKSYFKIAKDCNAGNNSECWANGDAYAGGLPLSDAYAFVDVSGNSWSLAGNTDGYGISILVDTNGLKGPNKYGQDRFILLPIPMDGNYPGMPVKVRPLTDCTSTAQCSTWADICPSIAQHPCYFTSWLYN